MCRLNRLPEHSDVNSARLQLFSKAKKGFEMLTPTRDALELHVARANHQAKIWPHADQDIIEVSTDSSAWRKVAWKLSGQDYLQFQMLAWSL